MLPEFELHKGRDISGVSPCLMDLLLSSAMNMVLKILYFGRMVGGDWYYVVFKKNLFNGLSSILDLSILT